MKDFNAVIGHDKVKEHLTNAIKLNKISHAYIINGSQGIGKNMIANAFAKALQCESETTLGVPCNECHSCIQMESGNQPDVIHITHEKPASIGVEDIREQLVGDIQIRPYSSRYKIYIMDDADLMTQQAQNAILKTIEEPPEYGIIMLLTENADGLLQTILSRCVRLNLSGVENSLIQKHLIEKYQIPDYEARFAVAFAQGCVGRAEAIVQSESFVQMKDDALHMIRYAADMTVSEMIDAVKHVSDYKLQINEYIDLLAMWYRDILIFKSTNNTNLIIFKEDVTRMREQAAYSSYEGVQNILSAMDTAKKRLRANVNFELTMELLFLTIKEN